MGGAWTDAKSEYNVAIGSSAMAGAMNAASNNTAVGYNAGTAITDGDSNVLIGYQAGDSITQGYQNVGIGGPVSFANEATAVNQIVLGYGATGHANNIAVIGNTSCTAWHPADDNGVDLGASDYRFANLYVGDVQMSNEGSGGNEVDGTEGKWTIQEGEDDLYLLNRKNGKKYKFKLEEVL